jgi:hypothetical protein
MRRSTSSQRGHTELVDQVRGWSSSRGGQPRHVKIPRTTKLYDRTGDEITLDEVEWITI